MDKRVVSTIMALVLVAATRAHTLSLSSSAAGSLIADGSPSNTTISAPSNSSVHPQAGSSSSHDSSIDGNIKPVSSSSSVTEVLYASAGDSSQPTAVSDAVTRLPVGSNSGSSSDHETESSHAESKGVSTLTTMPPVVYAFSTSAASLTPSNGASRSIATPSSADAFDDDSTYSVGAVMPIEERAAVQSTALEFSTSIDQIDDAETTPTPPTTKATTTPSSGQKAASTSDRTASHGNLDGDGTDNDDDTSDFSTSGSTLSNPIFCACVVLGVAGLVGSVFAFRAKRHRDVSEEWRVTAEASAVTPPRGAWAPPASQVRVVIDDRNFAIL